MRVNVLNTSDLRVKADVARLARRLSRDFPAPSGRSRVNVVLVNDRRIHELNLRHLKRDRATDVLAFPMGHVDPGSGETLLGEVYVSRDRARAQAGEYGCRYHEELRRLVLHGLLHLLGLGHREMEPLYEKYL